MSIGKNELSETHADRNGEWRYLLWIEMCRKGIVIKTSALNNYITDSPSAGPLVVNIPKDRIFNKVSIFQLFRNSGELLWLPAVLDPVLLAAEVRLPHVDGQLQRGEHHLPAIREVRIYSYLGYQLVTWVTSYLGYQLVTWVTSYLGYQLPGLPVTWVTSSF